MRSAPLLPVAAMFAMAAVFAERVPFDTEWRFLRADPAGAEAPAFDDSAWAVVTAPHTFNDTDTFDDFSASNHEGERNQFGGNVVYRKTFDAQAGWTGKRIFAEFEAVRQVAKVYLNGEYVGGSENGFLPFGVDLSSRIRPGARNTLVVKVDNRFVKDEAGRIKWAEFTGAPFFPWNNPHWHPAHGGLVRHVALHVKEPVHLTLPLFENLGTTGIYSYAEDVSAANARVGVEIEIANDSLTRTDLATRSEVMDSEGRVVLTLEGRSVLEAGKKTVVKTAGALAKPHLWDTADPYLYSVRTTLISEGKPVDTIVTPLGIRTAKISVKEGFSLNGHPLRLRGWGQKPTDEWPGLGAAIPDWMHAYTLGLMKDAGANFIRWGHCAAGPAQIGAGDRLGILALQPGVDGEADCTGHAWEVRAAAFRSALIYYRNNPSILVWEGGNQNVTTAHATQLRGYFETYDPHGGRFYAHRRPGTTVRPFLDLEVTTEGQHKYGDLPGIEGEYDRDESPRRVWDAPAKVKKRSDGLLDSETFAVGQVANWYDKVYTKWPAIAGGANWIFSDSTSGGRGTGDVTRASGEVDAVRLPKEAYYACKAMFRDDPQVALIGHWSYAEADRVVKTVHVVSNAASVELFLNGKSLGVASPVKRFLFEFPGVAFVPGVLEARASDASGKPVATDRKETAGPAVALRLTPMTGPDGWKADGADIALVDVEAVDAKGRRAPLDGRRVDFVLEGDAVWRGGYNGGRERSTNATWLDLEAGVTRISIRSKPGATGSVKLVAKSAGLPDAPLTLTPVR